MRVAILSVTFVAMAGAGFAGAQSYPAQWLKSHIEGSIHESCAHCKIDIGSVEVSFLNGTITFKDFFYEDSPSVHAQVKVRAKILSIRASLKALLRNEYIIEELLGDQIDFILAENPAIPSGKDDGRPAMGELPAVVIQHIDIRDSSFKYIDDVKPEAACLPVMKVNGFVGSFATRKELAKVYAPDLTPIQAVADLEGGGHAMIRVHADVLSDKGDLDLHVDVKDENLAGVHKFFLNEAKVKIEGHLLDVSTQLQVKDGAINGKLKSTYTALKVEVADPKNSGVTNFLENLGAKLILDSEKGVQGKPAGEAEVKFTRVPGQGLMAAIFKALGKAAVSSVKKTGPLSKKK